VPLSIYHVRFVFSGQPPDARACVRWSAARFSTPTEGPVGATFDQYVGELRVSDPEQAPVAFERVRARLFAYDIFPPRLMRYTVCPLTPIANGTVIVQRAGFRRLAIESAVRVVETWDRVDGGERVAGFRYLTLVGHPEQGWASFEVRLTEDRRVQVTLRSCSRPGGPVAQIVRPVARRIQTRATRAALRRLTASHQG
jgi:uncharacterized protein (UPF0548 family)